MSQPSSNLHLENSKSPFVVQHPIEYGSDDDLHSNSQDSIADLPRHFAPSNTTTADRNVKETAARRTSVDDTNGSGTGRLHRRGASAAFPNQPQGGLGRPSQQFERSDMVTVEIPSDEPPPSGLRKFYDKNRGLAYVLLAQVFGCLMNVTTRLLEIEGNHGEGMHPFQILFVRMAITTVLSLGYMWWTKTPHYPLGVPEVRWLLSLRGVGGFFGVFGMYYSLLYLPLADATVITFIAPVVSCFACSILLKEPFTRMEQIGAFISFFGVTLIARPTTFFQHGNNVPADGMDDAIPTQTGPADAADYRRVTSEQRFGAVCIALIGVLGSAMAFTTMRWIGKRAHPLLSVTYFSACCTVVSAIAMLVLPSVPFLLPADGKEWSYLIFLGFCGFTMQFLLSAGLQHEKSSRATNMVYTQMLFALFFDKLVFGTNPSLLSLLGSTFILGSAIYVAIMKESMKQREAAEKKRQEEAAAAGRIIEMERRDEEIGLVQGMDQGDEDDDRHYANGHKKESR